MKSRKRAQKLRKVDDSEYENLILKRSIAYLYFIKKKKISDKLLSILAYYCLNVGFAIIDCLGCVERDANG